ncbi:Protein 21.1 [Giardia lamblia P15]|uniref:Protein 21.1 n=1 Tax=Giardia intestinalis (strain P15) TaxID=658858 RepID=E1F2V0_GIAIA|nr:Protein 21.1 [Giardia lamblia P15]
MQLSKAYQKCKACLVGNSLLHCVAESLVIQDLTPEKLISLAKRLVSKCSGVSHALVSYYDVTVKGVNAIEFISPYVGWSIEDYLALTLYEGRTISEEQVYRFMAAIVWTLNQLVHICRTSLLMWIFLGYTNLSLRNFCLDEFGAIRFRLDLAHTLRNMILVDERLTDWPRIKGSELGLHLKLHIIQCILRLAFPLNDLEISEIDPYSDVFSRVIKGSERSKLFCSRMERLVYLFQKEDITLSHILHTNLFKTELEKYWQSLGVAMDDDASTPLIDSVRANDAQKIYSFYGRQAGMTTSSGKTALMIAASRGDIHVTTLLATREANYRDIYGNYATLLAIKNGYKNVALHLAAYESILLQEDGITPLMLHVIGKNLRVPFQELIQHAGKQMKNGLSALMIASLTNDLDYSIVLAKKEAGLCNAEGKTAGTLANEKGNTQISRFLARYEIVMGADGETQLHQAVSAGDLRAVEAYIHAARLYNKAGYTALGLAAKFNHTDIIKILIPHEAGMRCKVSLELCGTTFQDPTALAIAVYHNNEQAVNLLKRCEAGLTMKPLQTTAMMLAAACGYSGLISLLRTREEKMQDAHGNTALMYGVNSSSLDVVYKLMKYESRMQNIDGYTALMYAALHNKVQIVAALMKLEEGMIDAKGEPAIICAIKAEARECVSILVRGSEASYSKQCIEMIKSSTTLTCAMKRVMLRYFKEEKFH